MVTGTTCGMVPVPYHTVLCIRHVLPKCDSHQNGSSVNTGRARIISRKQDYVGFPFMINWTRRLQKKAFHECDSHSGLIKMSNRSKETGYNQSQLRLCWLPFCDALRSEFTKRHGLHLGQSVEVYPTSSSRQNGLLTCIERNQQDIFLRFNFGTIYSRYCPSWQKYQHYRLWIRHWNRKGTILQYGPGFQKKSWWRLSPKRIFPRYLPPVSLTSYFLTNIIN